MNAPEFPLIQLVVFDWAGTTVDFGSRAPATAFRNVFAAHGVVVTDAEALEPMGTNKREHLLAMLSGDRVSKAWEATHGKPWDERVVDTMYEEFMPYQLEAIANTSTLVPGLLNTIAQLRHLGCKIGGTTGYFRAAAEMVARLAGEAGFDPDANVCADDVPQGRPAPWMIYRVMQRLGIYPSSRVVNIGDTIADIKAGLAAGCWSIGVCDSSSLIGLSLSEFEALSDGERTTRLEKAKQTFLDAGAHAVIDTLSELPPLIEKLNLQPTTVHPHVIGC